jgi:uncharacterized protein with von Willebrand factor type A (vWA) domain
MGRSLQYGVEGAVVGFCRFVRNHGLSAGITETLNALRAIEAVGIAGGIKDRQLVKAALRAVLCSTRAEWDQFEDLFEAFWNSRALQSQSPNQKERPGSKHLQREGVQAMSPAWSTGEGSKDGTGKAVFGATVHERLKQADFADVSDRDLADLERIALRLLRQMSLHLSRRLKTAKLGDKVDLRRTLRLSISRGGEPIYLGFRHRKLQQQKLVILLDISGSMNPYSLFLARFAYALEKYFRRVDTFVFSTRLTDITAALRTPHLRDALQALSKEGAGWSGGTKIGESLREFNSRHGRLLSRNTLFIILSDGWDTGEPQLLAAELGAIRRRVRKVVWLNPLLGIDGYEPVTRGMSAALPHVDVFASAHNLESLLALERHLATPRLSGIRNSGW